jgi:hypothetical protein
VPQRRRRGDLAEGSEERRLERQGEARQVSQTQARRAMRSRFSEEIAGEAQGSRPALTGKPASRQAFMLPSSATARWNPSSRSLAVARVEMRPNSQ